MLKCEIEYLIRYSDKTPKLVAVYRPMFSWEMWPNRSNGEYGDLKLLPELSYGFEDYEKFSEAICVVVSDYTEVVNESRRIAAELGLIR
jgi:hypothetical protein